MEFKIIGWTDYDSDYPSISVPDEEIGNLLGAIVDAIKEGGYVISGQDHQNSATGVPVFENGACFRASMRAWATVMTYAYPQIDDKATNYMDFYMYAPMEAKLPKYEEISVEPLDDENFGGLIVQQDNELLSQSIQMNMPLMTTDKTLNFIYEGIMAQLADEDDGDGDEE